MALNPAVLAKALKSAALETPVGATTESSADATYLAMAKAIIEHIQSFGAVTVSVTGTIAGANAAGPVTGTCTATGSGTIS